LSLWNKNPADPNAGQMPVSAIATAALTGPTNVAEGELKLPIGVSEKIFLRPCTELIEFSPTPSSCAGWQNFSYPSNANELEKTFLGVIQSHTSKDYCDGCVDNLTLGNEWLQTNFDLNKTPTARLIPETTAPIYFNFTGGDVASLFTGVSLDGSYDTGLAPGGTPAGNYGNVIKSNGDPTTNRSNPALFETLFDYFRYRDGDNNPMEWSATVPVYEDNSIGYDCTNPTGSLKIIYFSKIIVTMPNPPPDKTITVHWDCNQSVITGRGGGAGGNLKGSIPNLVE
jgi:hypothetical protein